MKKMKNDNKGFTLVEMIVVLVILAILAAILVPALLGYIDEAKNKQLELHGKSVYTAAQAVASKMYGSSVKVDGGNSDKKMGTETGAAYFKAQVNKISEIDTFGTNDSDAYALIKFMETPTDTSKITGHEPWTVSEIIYVEGDNAVKLTSTSGAWESITKPTSSEETGYIKVE